MMQLGEQKQNNPCMEVCYYLKQFQGKKKKVIWPIFRFIPSLISESVLKVNPVTSFFVCGAFLRLTSIRLAVINLNIETAQMLRPGCSKCPGLNFSVVVFGYVVKRSHVINS